MTERDASWFLGPEGPLARVLPRYEHRPAQAQMAALVEENLAHRGLAMIEAGTGTGKTLAYLVPALRSGKRVVVSTATRNLQDQIMQQDLPLLHALLDVPFEASCVKGLANYLCLRRYHAFISSERAHGPDYRRELPVLQSFLENSADGERSGLALSEEGDLWAQINSGSDLRVGSRCVHYEDCFVTRLRRQAEQSNLIVVNHHLYFADLAVRAGRGAGVLPRHDAVIFDEAHAIEDIATDFFGVQVSTTRLETFARDARRAIKEAGGLDGLSQQCDGALALGSVFFSALPGAASGETGRQELDVESFEGDIVEPMRRLDSALDSFADALMAQAHLHEPMGLLARRAGQLRDDIAMIAEGGAASHVTWTERRGRAVSLGASPVDVSDTLRQELFEQVPAVVLTSATLTTGGKFDFVRARLGLPDELDELKLESPFDHARQACLYVPPGLPDPRDPDFPEAAARQVRELVAVTGGGAFVLCTSLRMMNTLYRLCAPHLPGLVLRQGDEPRASLLDRFREDGDAVLFASASFWEGVDVPGDALRLVIIDKLPFDVPSDPLVAARCSRMEERGEKPFMGYLVPSAALGLKQGFGRLIRGAGDRGVVAVLDVRLLLKGYGKVFLRSLPPATRCMDIDEVRRWWQGEEVSQGPPLEPPVSVP